MATSTPNPRASLLAGLRTGGVRSTSQPFSVPHTAAPTGHFNVPHYPSASHSFSDEEDEIDQLAELTSQFAFDPRMNGQQVPMTASAVESNFLFQRQQQQLLSNQSLHPNFAGNAYNSNGQQQQLDHLQAQMLQMEMLKYQALQQQAQYQAEFIAQTQRQMHSAQPHYSRSFEPMTAAPNVTSFDHRANAIAQLRARQLERLSIPSNNNEDYISGPMTASIDGKFGSRALNPHATSFMSRFGDQEGSLYSPLQSPPPVTPGRTTVISGGTSLGTMLAVPSPSVSTPSKSDAAVSWRRGVVTPNTPSRVSPPSFITKSLRDMSEETSRNRPEPLQLHRDNDNSEIHSRIYNESSGEDDPASGSSKAGSPTSASNPATPPPVQPTLSTEPKKQKLYEHMGIGRPISANVVAPPRSVSLPSRQPKGPPSGADELGPRNFASRIRRQAIGGLGVLVNAREQRELAVEVQAY